MKSLVKEYIKYYFPSHDSDWFEVVKSKRNLHEQIEAAALSLNSKGVMHGHQRRVGLARLKKYAASLLSTNNVDRIKTALRTGEFHNVYTIFKDETKNHYMVSSLTAYDVAQRLCFAHGLEPAYIYLHTGTATGVKNLNIRRRGKKYLEMSELPQWLTVSLSRPILKISYVFIRIAFSIISQATKTFVLLRKE